MSAVARPDWWCYPLECPAGHPWAPGRVTVGWMPCDCPAALAREVLGHLWVRCRAEGCPSIWYRPRHESSAPRGPGIDLTAARRMALAESARQRQLPGAWDREIEASGAGESGRDPAA